MLHYLVEKVVQLFLFNQTEPESLSIPLANRGFLHCDFDEDRVAEGFPLRVMCLPSTPLNTTFIWSSKGDPDYGLSAAARGEQSLIN